MDLVAVVGSSIASTGEPTSSVTLWRTTGHASAHLPVWVLEGFTRVASLAWSPDGLILAVAHGESIFLQSVHPPSSSLYQEYPGLQCISRIHHIVWQEVDLPALEASPNLQLVKSFCAMPNEVMPHHANASHHFGPTSDKIDVTQRSTCLLDTMAPGFPRCLQNPDRMTSILFVITEQGGDLHLQLFLAGGIPLGHPTVLSDVARVFNVIASSSDDSLTINVVCSRVTAIDRIGLLRYKICIATSHRHVSHAASYAHSLLSQALAHLEASKITWLKGCAAGQSWLAQFERPDLEDALMQLLLTGRTKYISLREHMASKAAERSYKKWESAALAAQTRLLLASCEACGPVCERIMMLFPGQTFEAVQAAAAEAYRKSLALEEATRVEGRLFSETAKFFRHELDRNNRLDMDPLEARGSVQNHTLPISATHNPYMVAKWLKSRRTLSEEHQKDELLPWIDTLIESFGALGRAIRDTYASLRFERYCLEFVPIAADIAAPPYNPSVRSTMTADGSEIRIAAQTGDRVALFRIGIPSLLMTCSSFRIQYSTEAVDLCDFGFFDDEELALLVKLRGRAYLWTLNLLLLHGAKDAIDVQRAQMLEQFVDPLTLALNGRAGRRLACAISGASMEIFDMDAEGDA